MSLLPLLVNELSDYYRRPHLRDIYDQHFGLGLLEDELLEPRRSMLGPLRSGYLRPWRNLLRSDSGVSSVQVDKNEFKVNLDVQQFKPEELTVKVAEGFIVVEGKHEERTDEHGLISRQFTRRYKLPADADVSGLVSTLSSDGVLSLKTPKKVTPSDQAREVPIIQTNTPAIKQEADTPKETDVKKEENKE